MVVGTRFDEVPGKARALTSGYKNLYIVHVLNECPKVPQHSIGKQQQGGISLNHVLANIIFPYTLDPSLAQTDPNWTDQNKIKRGMAAVAAAISTVFAFRERSNSRGNSHSGFLT